MGGLCVWVWRGGGGGGVGGRGTARLRAKRHLRGRRASHEGGRGQASSDDRYERVSWRTLGREVGHPQRENDLKDDEESWAGFERPACGRKASFRGKRSPATISFESMTMNDQHNFENYHPSLRLTFFGSSLYRRFYSSKGR